MKHNKTPVLPVKLTDIREIDEYHAEANKIKDVYLAKDKGAPNKPGNVGPYKTMRERILAMSLFPSIYNKHMVMTESGPE
jgi:hypothetical protein